MVSLRKLIPLGPFMTGPILDWKVTKGCRRPKNQRNHLARALYDNTMDVRRDLDNTSKKRLNN